MMRIKYDAHDLEAVRELCNIETIYRLAGGFNLSIDGLPTGYILPPLAPIKVDFKGRTASLAIRLRIIENPSGEVVKVAKGAPIVAGQHFSDGVNTLTVKSVDTSNDGYDAITATESVTSFTTTNPILFEAKQDTGNEVKVTPNALNYTPRKVEAGATVTAVGRAYEIESDKLYIPVTEADCKSLGDRFLFV